MTTRRWTDEELDRELDDLAAHGVTAWLDGRQLRFRAAPGAMTPPVRARLLQLKHALLGRLPARTLPLTEIQQAYWAGESEAFELGGVRAHVLLEFDRSGLCAERLRAAWTRLLDRHDLLRAELTDDGQLRVLPTVDGDGVQVRDLRHLSAAAAQQALAELRDDRTHEGPSTGSWPLFDVDVVRLPDGGTHVLLSLSLLICDASSTAVLLSELAVLCDDPSASLPPLHAGFADHARAVASAPTGPDHARDREYWRARRDSLPPAPDLPVVLSRHDGTQHRFVRHVARLDAGTWTALQVAGRAAGLTATSTLLAAYGCVLAQWGSGRSATVTVLRSVRPTEPAGIERVVGNFTDTLLLELAVQPGDAFLDRARRTQRQLWSDVEHASVSGVAVLGDLNAARGSVTRASMPVTFASALHVEAPTGPAADWLASISTSRMQTPQVWLDHQVYESAGELVLNWDVLERLFVPGAPAAMLADYVVLLRELAEAPDAWSRPLARSTPASAACPRTLDLTRHEPVQRIPAQVGAAQVGAAQVAPDLAADHTALADRIASLWSEFLDGLPVPRDTAFLDLGGRSLSAMRLALRLERDLGLRVPVAALFGGATVHDLVRLAAEPRRAGVR